MTFVCLAPIVFFSHIMDGKGIYNTLNSSSLHLMVIICIFSGMIAATGLDVVIGDFVDRATRSQTGKKKEMMLFAIVYLVSGLISTVLQNSYVALAFLPILKSIAKRNQVSLSKLVLFVIFSTTLGGAVTLIGTPTNVYANSALEEAGLPLFGMLDFAWVVVPIFLLGGLYMVIMNRCCASYDDFGDGAQEVKELTPQQKNKQKVVGGGIRSFPAFPGAEIPEGHLHRPELHRLRHDCPGRAFHGGDAQRGPQCHRREHDPVLRRHQPDDCHHEPFRTGFRFRQMHHQPDR